MSLNARQVLALLCGSTVLASRAPARASDAPPSASPAKKVVILAKVHGPADLEAGFAKQILVRELGRYEYAYDECLDNLVDEGAVLKIFNDVGIEEKTDSPATALLGKMIEAGCPPPRDATMFVAHAFLQNDPQAGQRSIVLKIRRVTKGPGEPLLANRVDASLDTSYPALITRVIDDTFGPKPRRRSKREIAGKTAMIAGGATVLAGAVVGVVLLSKKSDLDGGDCANRACGQSEYGNVDSYNSLRTVSTVAFVAGGIGLAAGVLLLKWGRPGAADVSMAIVPEQTGGVASVLGRF